MTPEIGFTNSKQKCPARKRNKRDKRRRQVKRINKEEQKIKECLPIII